MSLTLTDCLAWHDVVDDETEACQFCRSRSRIYFCHRLGWTCEACHHEQAVERETRALDHDLAALTLILLRDDVEQIVVTIAGRRFGLDPKLLQRLLR